MFDMAQHETQIDKRSSPAVSDFTPSHILAPSCWNSLSCCTCCSLSSSIGIAETLLYKLQLLLYKLQPLLCILLQVLRLLLRLLHGCSLQTVLLLLLR